MQIPINKDLRRYQEEIFMGLTLRQLLCSGIAIGFVIIVLESTVLYSGWRVWKTELRPKQKGKVKKIAFK